MKKIQRLIMILCLLLAGTSVVFADTSSHTGSVSLTDAQTGKAKAYQTAGLTVGGNNVISDVPAILFEQGGKTRALVPLRVITDNLGAEVTWDNVKKEAVILLNDRVIVLTANSTTALVDGSPYILPDTVPVKLMGAGDTYRTMVPIRFVSEQFGLDVGWVQDTRTVTVGKPLPSVNSVHYNDDSENPELVFKTTGEVEFSASLFLPNDKKENGQVVVDMADTRMDIENEDDESVITRLVVDNGGIHGVEGFQASVAPYTTRFLIGIDRDMQYTTEYDKDTSEIHMIFSRGATEARPEIVHKSKVIVLDAGHGGKDPGATSPYSRVMEKNLNISIAQRLKRNLESAGYTVYMTRNDDTYIGLYERAGIANNINADLFLSIHINASSKQEPNGVEMLYVPDGRDNAAFAQMLQEEVCKATGAYSIGLIKRPNLVVIRETKMPAVMAELGFLTNPNEEKLLLDEAYQNKLIMGMFNGITKYLK